MTLAVELLEGEDEGRRVEAESEVFTIGKAKDNDLVLSDKAVSRYHLELKVTDRGVEVTDLGSTNGTFLGSARIERAVVPLDSVLRVGRTTLKLCDGEGTTVPLSVGAAADLVIGSTPAMQRLMAQIEKIADSEVPCLLMGESGTGKEVMARAVQSLSKRSKGPFVTVDCGAFAPNLVASELFGHEKGAFTGADRKHVGAFERAHGGVLFLDEIGELPLDLQPQLLGALERRRFRRLGGQEEVDVDVQLVSATNRDLRVEVNEGTFRLDLYYRLAVVVLRLPPLRERRDDIPFLIECFLAAHADENKTTKPRLSADAMKTLTTYRWPGNVRELQNEIRRACILADGVIMESHLSERVRSGGPSIDDDHLVPAERGTTLPDLVRELEIREIIRALQESGGNKSRTAEMLGVSRFALQRKLEKYEVGTEPPPTPDADAADGEAVDGDSEEGAPESGADGEPQEGRA